MKRMLLQAGMTLRRRSPQLLLLGMLQTQKVSCGGVGGNWEGLRVLVPLQTDQDSLWKGGVQVIGEDYTAAGDSSVPGTSPSLGADLGCR